MLIGYTAEYRDLGVRKGLIVAAILELKQRGLKGCFIDWADDIETYTNLGNHSQSAILGKGTNR